MTDGPEYSYWVLFVDGPLKGQLRHYKEPKTVYEVAVPQDLQAHLRTDIPMTTEPWEMFPSVRYFFHLFSVLRRPIQLASIHANTEQIATAELFELLVSEKAKIALKE